MDTGMIITISINVITLTAWLVTQFNHVSHLKDNVKEIKDEIHELNNKVDKHGERISRIEGRMNGG